MSSQAHNQYSQTRVNTAIPGELTLMLFNGCLRFMKQAMTDLENKEYEKKNINIIKCQDILDELLITLNHKYEISKSLSSLYVYFKEKLFEANTKLDPESLQICIGFITELRDTWVEALKLIKTQSKVGV
ncbi:MAG: flagellar protein FliS [Bacilli bacterium]|nr:flagellar protein FliS [Bacilli bacterium]